MTKQEIINNLLQALSYAYPDIGEALSDVPPMRSNDWHFFVMSRDTTQVLALIFDETSNRCLLHCLTPPKDNFDQWIAKSNKISFGTLIIPYVNQVLDTIPLIDNMFLIKKDYYIPERPKQEYSMKELVSIISGGFSLPLQWKGDEG